MYTTKETETKTAYHLPPISPEALEQDRIESAVTQILETIGEDPARDGLLRTPDRVARMYAELTSGYHQDPLRLINGALFDVDYDEMVVVKDIDFYSLCEHHMLPFNGRAHVAYIPKGRVVGLSKIPRIVEMFARRLQVQERMTTQIADLIDEVLQPQGVAVVVEGAHMCMVMRGIKKANAMMTTSAMRVQGDAGGFVMRPQAVRRRSRPPAPSYRPRIFPPACP